ncbi:MAG: MarR family transcriptional regulator [Chloroflexota bacterium]|nr:MAG: MarR family transcriptional regulator [Chloroflexota bacterium]
MAKWTFITNHGLVLGYIARNPSSTARVIAQAVGITERTTHKIIAELAEAGYISRKKMGRKNQYQINPNLPLRHPSHGEVAVGDLLQLLAWKKVGSAKEQMKLPITIT